jgi:predicted NAD-dependent protein-ADP-ribosyltransferase YbiA (DUF1768 family)
METNEKDPVTVDAIQASFIDGLDYNYSKPIVVNGETIDLNVEVQKFFQDVANATIVGQGYSIKYRSIQPYLPVVSLDSAVGAMEQLRLLKDTIFGDETELLEEEKEANSQARANFINNLDSVRKLYVKQAYAKGVKSLNRIKFFPDYVQTVQSKGIQISSTKKGIGAMLTPNTKESKVLKSKFPIMYEGKQYDDVMAVYNAYKLGYEIESKRNNNNLLVKLMSDILAKRFVQYPRMFGLVYDLGGVSALEKSYYKSAKGLPAKAWSTSELGPGNYIQSLINAYNEVETELTPAWLETKEKAVPAEQQEDYQEGELMDDAEHDRLVNEGKESKNITVDPTQPTFDVEDLGVPLKKKTPSTSVNPAPNTINIYAGAGENAELSNFAIRPFQSATLNVLQQSLKPGIKNDISDVVFQSVEQAFQFAKLIVASQTKATENSNIVKNIISTTNGEKLRSLGKSVKGLDNKFWDEQSSSIMKGLLLESFKQNPNALAKLLATGDATLTHTQDKGKWGTEFPRILMEVRTELWTEPEYNTGIVDKAGNEIIFKYSEITVDNFVKLLPNVPKEILAKMVEHQKAEVRDQNKGFDFTNLC